MARRLDGKVAVVTGSTGGIGEGIAVALAREGAAVVVSGRRANWDRVFDLNARAAFFCSQAATPHMRARGGGSIVNIGSTHPFAVGTGQFIYGISKGALYTMTRKLAMLLAPERIRVNWISVGWVLTEHERALRKIPNDGGEWIEQNRGRNPLGDFVSVEDVAEGVIYLSADSGRSVTGTDLGLSGGFTIHI